MIEIEGYPSGEIVYLSSILLCFYGISKTIILRRIFISGDLRKSNNKN